MARSIIIACLCALAFTGAAAQGSWTDACNVTRSCFTSPSGCLEAGNCIAIVTVEEVEGVYTFEMESVGGVYVAVGLSEDAIMGSDSVVECVHDVNSTDDRVDVFVSFNSGKSNIRIPTGPAANGVTLVSSSYVEGAVHCRFTREAVTSIADIVFDLVNNQYHLLAAAGTQLITNHAMVSRSIFELRVGLLPTPLDGLFLAAAAGLAYHDLTKRPSSNARFLAEVGWFD